MIEDAGKPMPDKQWQTIKEICAGYFERDSVARRDDNPTYLVFRGKVISETSAKVTT